MLVIAQHQVKDPDYFWSKAKDVAGNLPPNLKLHSVFPSKDLLTGTCVWEGPSVSAIQKYLDDNTGNSSKNICYEVDTSKAVGLPKTSDTRSAVA